MREPEREFKDMVKALHRAGLELVLELFFDGKEAPSYVLDVSPLLGSGIPRGRRPAGGLCACEALGEDPYLSRLKLLAPGGTVWSRGRKNIWLNIMTGS